MRDRASSIAYKNARLNIRCLQ